MTDFLLKLFNVRASEAARISRADVNFHGVNPAWLMLLFVLFAAAAVLLYRRTGEDLPRWRRYTLAGLRCLFFLLILGLLLRPVLSVTFEASVRRSLILLLDASASMSEIKDQRTAEADLKRAAIARDVLDATKGLDQPLTGAPAELRQLSRTDLAKSVLRNPRLNLVPTLAKDYDLAAFTFDGDTAEVAAAAYRAGNGSGAPPALSLGWVDSLAAKGTQSAIGDAVREVITRKRGQPLAGILLVTDGANNTGTQPLDAATLAGQDRVPLYVYGVGITSPKDVVVGNIFAQEVAFAKDEVPVTVRVRSQGLAGQSATLVVQMGPEKAEKRVDFKADGEQVVTVNLTPKTPGQFDVRASIAARDDEVVKDNNAADAKIRVIDGKIKVLVVEQYPRWEFKYLQAVLLRDRRIEAKFVLVEGDEQITKAPDSPYLAQFPARKEELFKYDLLVIGDVDPKALSAANLEAIGEFVSKFGGALVSLAGKRHNPASYRRTVLEKMLPVELESLENAGLANRPVRLELTPAGKASQMLRVAETETDSAARWAQLPPVYWIQKVARAKPAAEVLAVDPDPNKGSRYGKMPVIALQQYGLGQVLYVGTDNLWRWRKNVADRFHAAVWGQMVQRMALPHLLGAAKRTQLTSDQKTYATGARVSIFARLFTETYEPFKEPAVRGTYADATGAGEGREVILRPVPQQPGMYRGEFTAERPGSYQFNVEHDKATKLEFAVAAPNAELADAAMNQALLEQMAKTSGGAFFREEDLHTLRSKLGPSTERIESTLEVELWSSPFYFLLLLIPVTAEWAMRKLSQLK